MFIHSLASTLIVKTASLFTSSVTFITCSSLDVVALSTGRCLPGQFISKKLIFHPSQRKLIAEKICHLSYIEKPQRWKVPWWKWFSWLYKYLSDKRFILLRFLMNVKFMASIQMSIINTVISVMLLTKIPTALSLTVPTSCFKLSLELHFQS